MTDYYDAGRLIQFGLQPTVHPSQNAEYRELVERAQDDREFWAIVRGVASGMGLESIALNRHGLRFRPTQGSVFGMNAAALRAINPVKSADDRLIGFLVNVAICARIYPRPRDLEEEAERPRPALSVGEVEDVLRGLCSRFEAALREEPDPETEHLENRIWEAWQAYHRRYADKETASGQRGRHGTVRLIERYLDFMVSQGLFARQGERYQPLYAYQVHVQSGVASDLVAIVHGLGETPETNTPKMV